MTAIILAGGESSRMKTNKALLPLFGHNLIEQITFSCEAIFEDIIISTNMAGALNFLPFKIVTDDKINQGTLMGILSCLKVSKTAVNFVIACDIPEINLFAIKKMAQYTSDYDVVVPVSGIRKYEPLYAFYNKNLISPIEKMLNQGVRKVTELYTKCRIKSMPMDQASWYYNLNTKDDYFSYLKTQTMKNESI